MEFKSLLESASTNSQRRYKCMYCTKSYERAKLVNHIDKVHEDMIPEGYTAARLVFNMINKKDHGTCTICGKESPWNEEKGRYDRICTNPECKKKYIKMTEERLQKARGMTKQQMLNDPEFQEKMLANRGISGKYKFQDGTYKTYTGTYEKKFLEFMDVFLHVNPADIYAPGPVIEYEYEGEKHKWITDFYYEPYNLVFDIKDGGENPNNRSMVHYRAKQIEKEKAIKKLNKYNYIRLTDNNFEQLVLLIMELKELYLDSNKDMNHIIRVNESSLIMENESIKDNGDLYLLKYNIDKEAMMENTILEFPYVLQEAKSGNKHPLFIVLSYTFTTFGKLTKAITHADYSHAAIAFEPSLHEMFSFNGDNKVNANGGFSTEDIDEYTKFSDQSYILINTVFVNDSQYKAIKEYVEEYKKNIKNTKYSFANIFRILLNKPINDEGSNQMVCSEFVYSIFKYINQDFLNKSTNLVTPQDLADVKNKRIYKIYEGLIKDYKLNKIEKKLSKLYNSAKVLGEQFILEAFKKSLFETPEKLQTWMHQNIKYKEYTKLMSHDEVLNEKKGSCHDQVMFELEELRLMKLNPKALFFIEYNGNQGGMTHSFVYYEKGNDLYWFENAWGLYAGIHKFKSLKDIKDFIKDQHTKGKLGNNKKYPDIEITTFKLSGRKFK